jgi:hypothetical protein
LARSNISAAFGPEASAFIPHPEERRRRVSKDAGPWAHLPRPVETRGVAALLGVRSGVLSLPVSKTLQTVESARENTM